MKICRISTVPYQVDVFLREQIIASVKAGHEVLVITSPSDDIDEFCKKHGASFLPIAMERRLGPWRDLVALGRLLVGLNRWKPEVIHSISSKAGFLAAIAAWMLHIPVRLHVFAGLPWLGMGGLVRRVAVGCDKVIVKLNHRCYADSRSQAKVLEENGVARPGEVITLGDGSVAGVDVARFDPDKWRERRDDIRDSCAIPRDAQIIVFVGRVTREKGIAELAEAYIRLADRFLNLYLLVVGPVDDDVDPVPKRAMDLLQGHPRVRFVGYQKNPETYLAVADILAIPSYREGFCNVVIEAACMEVPAVGARVMGLVDSIVDGETGILVEANAVEPLAAAMETLLVDHAYRKQLGAAAQWRARRCFDQTRLNKLVLEEYVMLQGRLRPAIAGSVSGPDR